MKLNVTSIKLPEETDYYKSKGYRSGKWGFREVLDFQQQKDCDRG
ncbi:MAG: hypothetical protein ACLU9T_17985 [Blautia faecis]